MSTPPRHPADRPELRGLMLGTFTIGSALLIGEGGAAAIVAGSVVAFACFVVAFGLYIHAWLLREHELWREARRSPGPDDAQEG